MTLQQRLDHVAVLRGVLRQSVLMITTMQIETKCQILNPKLKMTV